MTSLLVLWLSASSLPTPGAAVLSHACAPVAGVSAAPGCDLGIAPAPGDVLLARGGRPREPWGYYLGWGIADWSIAGGMWLAGTYLAAMGTLLLVGDSGAQGLGLVFVGGSAGLGIGGAFVAQHAAANIETARRLRGR